MDPTNHSQKGFTLVEMIMVIVITGILSGMVAVFIKGPVESYFDMARRAELTDVADTAVRRMARDIRSSVPNTLRNPTDGSDQCIEFVPAKAGARYRADQAAPLTPTCPGAAPCGDILDFTATDASFDMLGQNASLPAAAQIAAGDIIVVYNDGSTRGNAYAGTNAILVAASGVTAGATTGTDKINFTAAGALTTIFGRKLFPSSSPANRFLVVPANEQVVSFACSGGTLFRYSRLITSRTAAWAQPATCAAMAAAATGSPITSAILATNVSTCSLKYEAPGSGSGGGRFGLVSISLGMTQTGESVSLYNQVHVDNTP
jgi:MSHA biogenesis protein MshO